MIYFIQFGTDGPIKIGTAVDPIVRLRTLQTGTPEPLTLLAVVPGGRTREAEVHRALAHHRRSGEWFEPDDEVFEFVRTLQSPEYVVDGAKAYAVLRRLDEHTPTLACPFCGRNHSHGLGDGHRVAHCVEPSHPEMHVGAHVLRARDGYFLKTGLAP